MSNQNQSERIKELIGILWGWSKGYRPCGIETIQKAIDELKEQSDAIVPRQIINIEGLGQIETNKDFLKAIETLKSHYVKTARFNIGAWVMLNPNKFSHNPQPDYYQHNPIIGTVESIAVEYDRTSARLVYTIKQVHKNREESGRIRAPEAHLTLFDLDQLKDIPSKRFIYQGWLIKAMMLDGNALKFKGNPKFLVEQIKEDIENYGSLLTIRWCSSDRELTQEEFQEQIAHFRPRVGDVDICGIVDICFENGYNDDDGSYSEESFSVGNANILKLLENAIGEYVVIEIICDF